jgi:hypothetical protein
MTDVWTCVRCGVESTEKDCKWLKKNNEYRKACAKCQLEVWDVPIYFIFHWGIPDWVEPHMKSTRVFDNLRQWFRSGPPCYVHFFLRSEVDTLGWQYRWNIWDHENLPRGPYSYRGWCGDRRIIIIVDDNGIETPESIEWITYHELGHHECQSRAFMADAAFSAENKNDGRTTYAWQDDEGHEADSEERHVNRLATAFMGGREYARPWWRKRVNAFLAGETSLPDCHAVPVPEPSTEPTQPEPQGICVDPTCSCKGKRTMKKKKNSDDRK